MKCPKCRNSERVKSGFMKEARRYKCKLCGCNYSVDHGSVEDKERKRRFALSLCLEGLGFHSIVLLLGISHVSELNRVHKYGRGLAGIRNPCPCKAMELDGIHPYVGLKKAVAGFGLMLIEMPRNTSMWLSGTRLWQRNGDQAAGIVAADRWKAHNEFIPADRSVQTKAETYTVEGHNSLIGHLLARFRRKTKCHSKSMEMMEISLKLLTAKRNNSISMQYY